jgi:hypothetical protein
MKKIDYKKELKAFYSASAKQPNVVELPPLNYLAIDGSGDPNTSQTYKEAVEALFSLAYTIKFFLKKSPLAIDYGVMPLEGLWWADDMRQFSVERKSDWLWTLMIMQPEVVSKSIVATCKKDLAAKKSLAALSKVEFRTFREGKAAQILHIGRFSDEGPIIQKLHAFIKDIGGELAGKHHELYLTDIRRAAPSRWKTIIRQPMSG